MAPLRTFFDFGLSPRGEFASNAPAIVVARRVRAKAFDSNAGKLGELDISDLGLPPSRPRRGLGWGAVASVALHGAFVAAALLWSQSQIERAPEPLAVEIVVERAPAPAPPAPDPQPAPPSPPAAEVAPAVEPPPPAVETPPPAQVEASPAPTPAPTKEPPPPEPTLAPTPTATAVMTQPAVVETPPPPVARVAPPKPTPAPKKIERAATPAKPKPSPKPAAAHDAQAAEATQSRAAAPAASSASVGEYRDTVYARIQAHQHFPDAARETGAHGVAELAFSLDEAGQVVSAAVVRSSGDAQLDADALATVRRAAPFGPPPHGAARNYAVKLRYQLQ